MCSELQLSLSASSACSVVRMSLNAISCACSERPDVWMWYLSFCERSLPPYLSRIALRPDAPRDAAEHRVLGVHAVREEERQVGREVVDVHPARQVVLDEGEAVGERERELRDRVRAGLGDVIAGDRDRVEVADLLVDEVLLDVAHQAQRELGREDAGVLRLVLLEDVGLHGAAHRRERRGADLLVGLARQHLVAGDAEQHQAQAVVALGERALIARPRHAARGDRSRRSVARPRPPCPARDPLLALLIDGGVQEEAEQHRRRAVDGHRHRRRRIGEVEAGVELLGVVDVGDRDARVADLAVDVGSRIRILAVERDRVERRREPLGGQAARHVVEALVGALRAAFAGEHARRILAVALEREDAGGEREVPGRVLAKQPGQKIAPVLVPRQRDLGDAQVRERLGDEVELDRPCRAPGTDTSPRRSGASWPATRRAASCSSGCEARLEIAVERHQLAEERRLALDALGHLHDVGRARRLDDLEPLLADVGAQRLDGAVELVHPPRDRRLRAHERVVAPRRSRRSRRGSACARAG